MTRKLRFQMIADKFGVTLPSTVTGVKQIVSDGANLTFVFAGSFIATTVPNKWGDVGGRPLDVNGDGVVNCTDSAIVRLAFGTRSNLPGWDSRADLNMDNVVDIRDLALIRRALPSGTVCP